MLDLLLAEHINRLLHLLNLIQDAAAPDDQALDEDELKGFQLRKSIFLIFDFYFFHQVDPLPCIILLEGQLEEDLVDGFDAEPLESSQQLQDLLYLQNSEEFEYEGVSPARYLEIRLEDLVDVDQVDGDEVPHQ